MLFLSILLNILKIIGIVILVLLGIVILLLCLLLFVPIRYKVHAEFHGRVKVTAHVTYLLRLLHVSFNLDGTGKNMQIRLLGRNISEKKEKPIKEERSKPVTAKAKTTSTKAETESVQQKKAVKREPKAVRVEEKNVESVRPQDEAVQAVNKTAAKTPVADTAENKNNKKEKNKNTNTKTGGIIDNIKTVTELLKENKSVLTFIFRQIKLLFRHVLPGSHVINIRLGLDDPAMLGEILGAVAVVRASTGLVINIIPVWDEAVFEADADLKGRIILGRILFIAARVYFNKDVKKLISAVRK